MTHTEPRSSPRRRRRSQPGRKARRPIAAQADLLLVLGYIVLIALFGGGVATWGLAYLVLACASVALVLMLAWRDGLTVLDGLPPGGKVALLAVLILPLLQIVPLPPAIWQALPGQDLRHDILRLGGMADRWQPLSLDPLGSALCALLAAGFAGLTGFLVRLSDADFRRVLLLAFGLVLLNIIVGLLQVVSGGAFPKFFASNMGATMLGFYANKNHIALVLAISMLLFDDAIVRHAPPARRSLLSIAWTVFAMICIVATNSRAGLGLGLVAAAIVANTVARGVKLRWRLAAVAGAAILCLVVASSPTFKTVFDRFNDVDDDLRWRFLAWSQPLVVRYAVVGSGAGSFATLFAAHEHLAWVKPTYVNAVHDDYVQLLLELGVAGVLALAFLLWSVGAAALAYRRLPKRDSRRADMMFGFGVVLLCALHSIVDYPLRRPGVWMFLAIALAALYRGWRAVDATASPLSADPRQVEPA